MRRSVVIKRLGYEVSAGWTTYGASIAAFSFFQGVATRREGSSENSAREILEVGNLVVNAIRSRMIVHVNRRQNANSTKMGQQDNVSDGKAIRSSQNGRTSASESPVFTSRILQGSLNDAHRDVTTTLRLLFDREFLQTALVSQNILFAGQDEIEGDPCHIVLYVRASNEGGNASDYFWVSTQTGLPRASQRLLMVGGQSSLHPRFIISNIKLNPVIPPETFLYDPKASDSSSATEPKNAPPPAAEKNLTGTLLPDLELRDIDYKPVKMIDLKGERTLISFWAPWCGPCIGEFAVLKKLQEEYKGKLKIIAVAVQDSRLNVVEFIKKNSSYKFIFLSDPELPDGQSRVSVYFDLSLLPTSVFVDSQGKVIDRWAGFENESQLVKKIQQLMER